MTLPWIKITSDIHRKRQTNEIVSLLKLHSVHEAVGYLVQFWAIAEEESDSQGFIPGWSRSGIDSAVGRKGFASALVAVGWLTEVNGGFQIPTFDRHMGAKARERVLDADRKARKTSSRQPENLPDANRKTSGSEPESDRKISGSQPEKPSREDLDLDRDSEEEKPNPSVSTDDGLRISHASEPERGRNSAGTEPDSQPDANRKPTGNFPEPNPDRQPEPDRKSTGKTPSSEPARYDPLKAESERCRRFVAAWNAAGFRPMERLTASLAGRLHSAALDPDWDATFEAALAKAGGIPFFHGVGRQQGPLDPFDVLKDPDWVRQVLAGRFDPRPETKPARPGKSTITDTINAALAEQAARAAEGGAI